MKLGEPILRILAKTYAANSMIEQRVGRYDLSFKTDSLGRPVLLYMGKIDGRGKIKGERYARKIVTGPDGKILKDHWDNKGKTTS